MSQRNKDFLKKPMLDRARKRLTNKHTKLSAYMSQTNKLRDSSEELHQLELETKIKGYEKLIGAIADNFGGESKAIDFLVSLSKINPRQQKEISNIMGGLPVNAGLKNDDKDSKNK